jgi:hypothetical protein
MVKLITVPILGTEYKVRVLIGDNPEEARKVALKYVSPSGADCLLSETNRGYFVGEEGRNPLIWINTKTSGKYECFGTVAHEAVHAVFCIYDLIGEDVINSEVFAHMVGNIVREVQKRMKKGA